MENMKNKGIRVYCDQVEEWLDCGNKNATVFTNQRILEIKKNKETLVADSAVTENSVIIEPCFLGENVRVINAVVGPHVSLEKGAMVRNAVISNSIIREEAQISNTVLTNSMIGKNTTYNEKATETSLGDYSVFE